MLAKDVIYPIFIVVQYLNQAKVFGFDYKIICNEIQNI